MVLLLFFVCLVVLYLWLMVEVYNNDVLVDIVVFGFDVGICFGEVV